MRLSSLVEVVAEARRLRAQVRNWYVVGPLAWLVLPSRLPPRRGMLGSPLARRVITARLRNGMRLRCRIEEFEGYLAVFLKSTYDVPGIRWELLESIIDVGANVGTATIWLAARAPKARIAAVEPNPEVWQFLAQNVQVNGLDSRVQLIQAALGAASGTAYLEPGRYSIETRLAGSSVRDGLVTRTVTLADLLDSAGMAKVDLLKLDCEGAEYEVLHSSNESVLRRIGAIVGEYHAVPGRKREELGACLAEAGFSVSFDGGASQGMFRALRRGAVWTAVRE